MMSSIIYHRVGNKTKWSSGERRFKLYWRTVAGAPFLAEVYFHHERRWRFDFAWPEVALALEVEGGVFQKKGGHTTGSGYTEDCEKYNAAIYAGWTIIRLTTAQITINNLLMLKSFYDRRKITYKEEIV